MLGLFKSWVTPNSHKGKMMGKNKETLATQNTIMIDEIALFVKISEIIENRKYRVQTVVNSEATLMFWEVGNHINSTVLDAKRATYGKQIVVKLSQQLQEKYGKSFELTNLRRIMRFAEKFTDYEIVATLSPQLSWSHIIELLPLKSEEARLYYAQDVLDRKIGVRELRRQISRKAYERREIANTRIDEGDMLPFNVFKDPYMLDLHGLKDNFAEADLEKAILLELEAFLLEFGNGFTFVARQKRMTIEDDDFWLDLLFYHRDLCRLVAVELKIGKFKPQYKGQMELYLKWLDRYERRPLENSPIGIILCTAASREQVELLELNKSGIAVAEYWTSMPPKAEFERKIREILTDAKERLSRRKLLTSSDVKRDIEYFYESKDDDE